MRQGKELIRATNQFAKEHKPTSWYYVLSTLGLLVTGLVLVILAKSLLLKLALSVITGLLLSRMFVIYHDFRHGTILRGSKFGQVLMTLFGLLTLAPRSIWDESHDHHHNHNSKFSEVVVGSFPVITKSEFEHMSKRERIKYLALRHPLMILFAYLMVFQISFCLYPFFENPRKHWDCLAGFLLHNILALVVYIFGGWLLLISVLIIPMFIFSMLGSYIFYAQHNFPEVELYEAGEWDYVKAALRSSSYIKMNRVWRWISANIGFHHIHHVNSRIPFYRLEETMKAIPEFQSPRTTSLSPLEIYRCLRLKLWDEQQKKMVPL